MPLSTRSEFIRPVPLALAALAIVGWLVVALFWTQTAYLRGQLETGLRRAEIARQGLAADYQNLQKAAGTTADLKTQADRAQKALSDAASARASAQNELAELTKQVNESRLAVSGAQEEASAKAKELEEVGNRLKIANDQLTALQNETATLSTQRQQIQDAVTAATDQLADLRRQVDEATRALVDLQARTQAAPPK